MADSHWIVLSGEKKKFDSIFDSLGPTGGKLSGDKVKPVLLNSKLPTEVLGQVWELSDIDKDGFLDREEFCVAMHLVYKALEHEPVPAVLPKNLIPPSKRKPALIGAVPVLPPVSSTQNAKASLELTSPMPRSSIPNANPIGALAQRSKSGLNIKAIVPDIEFTRFSGIFAQKSSLDGYITGSEARHIFVQSGLPQQILAHVWNLCDQQLIGKLDQDQFILAMHFIAQEVKGIKAPMQLPAEVTGQKERDSGNLSDGSSSGVGDFSAVRELDALNREIEDLRQEKETLTSEIREKEQTAKIRSNEVQELQNTLDRAGTSLSQLESDKAEVHTRIDELDQQQLKLDGMIADNRAKVQEELRVIAALHAQIKEQELVSKRREEEHSRMKNELESLKKEKMQLEQSLSIGEQQLQNITNQVDSTRSEIKKVKEHIFSLAEQKKTVTSNIEQYGKAVAALKSETEATDEASPKLEDVSGSGKDDPFQSSDPFASQNLFKSDPFAESPSFSNDKSEFSTTPTNPSDAFGHAEGSNVFGPIGSNDVFGTSESNGAIVSQATKDVFECVRNDASDPFSAKDDPFSSQYNTFSDDPFGGSDPFSPTASKELEDHTSQSSKVFSINFNDPNTSASLFNDSENDTARFNTTDDPWAAFGGSVADINDTDTTDPFSKDDSFSPNPSESYDAFGSSFVPDGKLKNNATTADPRKMSEDAQLAWASEQSKKMEEERRERMRLQEQKDLEYAIKLNMTDIKQLKDKDLYKLFEVAENATTEEIRKSYRRKALKHHPDKNPDDPNAADVFNELSECLKILVDVGARAAYDHVRKVRKATSARAAQLDVKRRKEKLDLEARELEAERREKESSRFASRTLEKEVERLREDGMRILEEERLYMRRILKESVSEKSQAAQLKVKWKILPNVATLYTKQSLMNIFSKHGDVTSIAISCKRKRGNAIVEFEDSNAAQTALNSEIGFTENPLVLSWLSGRRAGPTLGLYLNKSNERSVIQTAMHTSDGKQCAADDDEFEETVLKKMKMKQEEKDQEVP